MLPYMRHLTTQSVLSRRAEIRTKQSSGEPGDFLRSEGIVSMHKLWLKVNCGRYSAHYQFANGKISRVTLQLKN